MSLKSIVRLLLALTINQIVYSQQKNFSFTLKGKVNLDTGRISLNPVNDAKFYPIETLFKEVKIQNGKFSFNGNTPCPIIFPEKINLPLPFLFCACAFINAAINNKNIFFIKTTILYNLSFA